MRTILRLAAGCTLFLAHASMAQEAPITAPVWIIEPARPWLTSAEAANGDLPVVPLTCVVVEGRLSDCQAPANTPARLAEGALSVAAVARLAAEDQAGRATEGRPITVNIRFMYGAIPVAIDPPPAPPTPEVLTSVTWLERPGPTDFGENFPAEALRRRVEARVVLDCLVAGDGRLACNVISEDPPELGFGDASLRVARKFRMAPATRDGHPTAGGRVRVPITWRILG